MDVINRIESQLTENPVILYMKGTPAFPQCGFSSTVHGNNIAVDDQRNKLRLVVETAREVWGDD